VSDWPGLAALRYWPDDARFTSVVLRASSGPGEALAVFTSILFTLNVVMFTFNLIPIAPLDGSAAVTLLMDERLADRYRELMLQPAVSTFGLFFAWQAYGPVFRPLFRLALRCLYPGHF
jgi:Zn-dependent protease